MLNLFLVRNGFLQSSKKVKRQGPKGETKRKEDQEL